MKDNEYKYHQYVIVGKSKSPIFSSDGWTTISDDPFLTIADARTERRRLAHEYPSWDVKIIRETIEGKEVR